MPAPMFPNSGGVPEPSPIMEAWSDAARAAAAASRGKAGKGKSSRQAAGRAAYRAAGGVATGSGRMRTPKTDNESLNSSERPIDYGAVHGLMMEKYGKGRGNKMYMTMANSSNVDRGLHFVVGTKIAKEKKVMMRALGLKGHIDDHNYRTLHAQWSKATPVSPKAPRRTRSKPSPHFNPSLGLPSTHRRP